MYTTETKIRIHYALTDQMGFVYHGHYAQFYEIGRGEAIRTIGYTYKDIEAMGIIMPVVDIHSRFLRPAKYDDLITVKTTLRELPIHHKIVFHSEIFNEEGALLNTGDVTLYFMEVNGMKRCAMPQALKSKLEKYFPVPVIDS
ncbi:MAG: thioesterase family protein [Ferruginibacter sp.]